MRLELRNGGLRKLLKNCEVCGRVFAHPTRVLCEDCYNEVQAKYRAVKEYLQKNPGATVAEVAQAAETDVEVIYQFIREGRLSVVPKDAGLTCEICGRPITVGRICHNCRSELEGKAYKPPAEKDSDGSRVRYLDQIRRQR